MIEWTADLPTKPGRYFVRPLPPHSPGRIRGHVVTVSDFGGSLVAWAGPNLYEFFRMAALDRVHIFLNEPGLEWGYIDDVTDWDWNHAPEPREVHEESRS